MTPYFPGGLAVREPEDSAGLYILESLSLRSSHLPLTTHFLALACLTSKISSN